MLVAICRCTGSSHYKRAIGTISVDAGAAHSAGALGCPLVVLLGTADPGNSRAGRKFRDRLDC